MGVVEIAVDVLSCNGAGICACSGIVGVATVMHAVAAHIESVLCCRYRCRRCVWCRWCDRSLSTVR